MKRIAALGVRFSLDDFGTGYSSLSYLKRLPLQQLKIDKSFVDDLVVAPDGTAIAQLIVALGDSLGLEVIAEGVEQTAQRDALLRLGCRRFQGYLFGRPMPLAALESLLSSAPDPDSCGSSGRTGA
jgi:EAL domain-containing protein (putative c-di-GMP-specific phosphodiesterase class I)